MNMKEISKTFSTEPLLTQAKHFLKREQKSDGKIFPFRTDSKFYNIILLNLFSCSKIYKNFVVTALISFHIQVGQNGQKVYSCGLWCMNYILHSMISKTDYSTPNKKGKPQSTLSTGLGEEQQSYFTTQSLETTNLQQDEPKVSPFDFNNFRSSQRKITMKIKQEEKLRKRKILKEVLNKMVVTHYFNKKSVFNRIRELPEKYQPSAAKNQHALDKIAQELIFKTPVTVQTAFLRSIIRQRSSNVQMRKQQVSNKIQVGRKNSIANLNHSLIIYPCEHIQLEAMEKRAILFLQQLARGKIKRILSCFRKNAFNCIYIKGYIRKCIVNLKQNQLNFIRKLRVMTKMHRESVMATKRKSLQSLLTKCLLRRDMLIMENLKALHHEIILKKLVSLEMLSRSERYHKLSAFFAIYRQALKNNREKAKQGEQNAGQTGKILQRSSIRNLRFQIESLRKSKT